MGLSNITFARIQESARLGKVPRGISRSELPALKADEIVTSGDLEGCVSFETDDLVVVIAPGLSGFQDASKFSSIVSPAQPPVEGGDSAADANADAAVEEGEGDGEGDGEGEGEGEGDNGSGNDSGNGSGNGNGGGDGVKVRDLIVLTKTGGDDAGVDVDFLDGANASLYIKIAFTEADAELVCDLTANFQKAMVNPFAEAGGRLAFKEAKRPVFTYEYEDDPAFKLAFNKRGMATYKTASNRLQTTYDGVFQSKLLTTTRGVVGRCARKHKLSMEWKLEAARKAREAAERNAANAAARA